MIEIRPLIELNPDVLHSIINGYVSSSAYHVSVDGSEEKTVFTLEIEPLPEPHRNTLQPSEESVNFYIDLVEENFSLAAYDEDGQVVGIGLAEPRKWNRSLWIWEFHIDDEFQGQGVGRMLMEGLAEKARAAGLRIMVAEAQNTNVAAIAFYRKLGFAIEGLDVSYYSNKDMEPGGEVAVFMKRRLE